ncbi:hypothetical protein AAC387_Pa01g3184 [Persea americana]
MDYDDSDFRSQNFQLGGEDNKFPPGLQSYALPKFDLDEQLHLKFDNLVETEVLLGIPSQEENHWIEDYSQGNSGIEFSSSAAESCSISMRNNVWSEATSSESVEMLLKSVGDDEMNTKKNINEESRVCEGLGSLDNQMDLCLNHDDSLPSKMEDAIDTDSMLPSDRGPKSTPGPSKDAAWNLPKADDMQHIEQDENSGFENLSDLDPISASEKYETYVNITAENCNLEKNIILSSVEKSAPNDHGSAACGMTRGSPDNNAVECVEVDALAASMKDSIVGAGVLNDQKNPREGTDGCSEVVFSCKSASLQKDDAQTGEIAVFSKDVLMDGQHRGEHPADGCTDEVKSASSLVLNADLSLNEIGHDGNVLFEKPVELLKADASIIESGVVRKDTEMSDDLKGNAHDTSLIVMEGKHQIEPNLAASSNDENADLSNSISKGNATANTTHAPLEIVEVKDGDDGLGIHSAEDSEFAVTGIARTDKVSGTGAHSENPDVPVVEKENMGLSAGPRNSETEIYGSPIAEKRAETPSPGVSTTTITSDVCGLQCELVIGDAAAASTEINLGDAAKLASLGKLDEHSEVTDEIVDQKVGISHVPILDSVILNRKEEGPANRISTEPCASGAEGDCKSHVSNSPISVSDSGQDSVCNSAAELQPGVGAAQSNTTVDKSVPTARAPEMKELGSCEVLEVSSKEDEVAALHIAGAALNCREETSLKPLTSSQNNTESNPLEAETDDKGFTFKVGSLADPSESENDRGWKPFSPVQPSVLSQTREGLATSGLGNAPSENVQGASCGSHQISDVQKTHSSSKATNENRTKSVSGTATEKKTGTHEKASKRSSHQKKTKDSSPFNALTNLAGTSKSMPVEELRHYSCIEGSSLKSSCVPAAPASNLPDLNSSALTISHQPFTDLQQFQLRAQIFVYGSLIQGIPPDEACMQSAFGDTSRDGGKSLWENVWRLAVERFHNQKSPVATPETPVHSRPGIWTSEQLSKSTPLQSKTLSTHAGRTGNKGAPSAIASSVMSPIWNISTPSRDGLQPSTMPRGPFLDSHHQLQPLHPYQSPQMRHYVGSTTHWPSQSPCPLPWVVSPQPSAVDASVHYSALPNAEAVQVKPVRNSSVPRVSNMPLATSSPSVTAVGSVSVPAGTSVSMEAKRTVASSGKPASADQKSRKRKKNLMSEEHGQISSSILPRTEPASAAGVAKQFVASITVSSPAHPELRAASGGILPVSSPIAPSTHYQVVGGSDMERRVIFSDETGSRIDQAKLHAEDAAAVAASAVKHCQGIWSQLAIQKSSGLISEVELKLASAAVAAAAAASVAKAAAAAAKVASDAALQAKLMADEAMSTSKMGNSIQPSETSLLDSAKNLGMISPASILIGNDKINSSNSVILAAREAARKRVEAASAAAKRAENLDAVVKAAELAAEAVSQAGIIIAMGDPIPLTLSELAEAGSDGYWRVQRASSEQVKPNDISRVGHSNIDGSDQGLDRPAKRLHGRPSNKKGTLRSSDEGYMPLLEVANLPVGNHAGSVNGMRWDSVTGEKGLGGASLASQNDEYEGYQQVGMSKDNNIMEGSDVEVASDETGLQGVWFSAKVLSLKDGKAYVCHNKLLQHEGSEKLKEWISLEGEGNKAPRIRIAHPVTAMKFEGTRKRRREAMGNYVWSIGDQVDAWMHDGWWEGVVTEKSKEDETKLTVQLTAGGESSIVRTWNLRPSLVWKDGQWMEWSRENNRSQHEGDAPQDKRQKLGMHEAGVDPQVDVARGEDKPSRIPCNEDLKKPEESRSLVLSEKERIFSVGKATVEDKNSNLHKMKRTGLQKEGSRVVIGVPKPGKKRKFMEVSKHYIADRAPKISEGSESIKFTKYLMPQGPRGLKNTHKVDFKGKAAVDLKPKMLRSGKAHVAHGRSMPEKDNSSLSVVSTSSQDTSLNTKASSLHHEKNKHNLNEAGSFSNIVKAAEAPMLFSSLGIPSDVLSSQKKPSSKGNRVPSGEKLARDEERSSDNNLGRTNPDTIEPRRSNRRIQPTSRLLEGLQSSLIITKIPPISHDKGVKAHYRSGSSSRGNNRG